MICGYSHAGHQVIPRDDFCFTPLCCVLLTAPFGKLNQRHGVESIELHATWHGKRFRWITLNGEDYEPVLSLSWVRT